MERSGATASFGRSREERGGGAGGKLRRPSARKPPTTPYARPPSVQAQAGDRRWISRLVDPAYRLIAGGATRYLPSFFSKSAPPALLPAPSREDHDKFDSEEEEERDAGSDDNECNPIHGTSRTPEAAGPSGAGDTTKSRLAFVRDEQDKNNELSDNAFSEIEQLVKGKSFSKDEIDRLMEIIHSRAVDHPVREQEKEYPSKPAEGKAERPVVASEMPSKATEEKQEDLNRAVWATSTPLPLAHSTMRDEVGASPIDIARAYMGSRTSETGIAFKSITSKDERPLLYSDDFLSKPSATSPAPKSAICWPGATVQDQRVLSTPQSQRRVGLHNFPRTPYSRTIFSKSKSKQPQLQDDSNKRLNIASSPFQYSWTPIFGQAKSRSDVVNDGYGSVGPIRRIRHKTAEKPPTGSYLRTPLSRPSQTGNSVTSEGFLLAVKKNLEPGETSGAKQVLSLDNKPHSLDVGVSAVPRHTSQLARIISEHIDRNPVTPKDKSAEITRATAWKKPQSSDDNAVKRDDHATTPSLGGFNFHKNVNQIHQMNSGQQKANGGNSFTRAPPQKSGIEASDDVNNISSASDKIVEGHYNNSGPSLNSQVQNTQEDVSKTIPDAAGKPEAQSPGRKPNLANISINKSQPQWGLLSNQSAGFTFPVSAASGASSEPPTPTIIPVLSGSNASPPKEVATTDPKFEFGSKSSSSRLIFSFPSTSSSAAVPDAAAADLKFNFGSDKKRVSFASIKKDGICY